jgi:hypothetical protein
VPVIPVFDSSNLLRMRTERNLIRVEDVDGRTEPGHDGVVFYAGMSSRNTVPSLAVRLN